jgi:4-diphosphocytidyl-2-C-methyl-D-erythritol kinase
MEHNTYLRVPSYAKVNLSLQVLGERPDHYMEIKTILQTVSLRDFLYFRLTDGPITLLSDSPNVPSGEENLVYKAAVMLKKETGTAPGVEIRLKKRIPVAAGLGGGSSNAAVTLLTLNSLWNTALDGETLHRLACSLGMDVPFFLLGGTVLGLGRGEEVYPLEEISGYNVLLVNPRVEISTLEIYKKAKKLLTLNTDSINMSHPLYHFARIESFVFNNLEACVQKDLPIIARIREGLKSLGAVASALSGSGSTVFGLFTSRSLLLKASDALRYTGWQCIPTRLISRKEYKRELQNPRKMIF